MSTYTPVASQTLSSSASSVTFSNIPQDYTDLVLVCQVKATSTFAYVSPQFNGDTGTNYSNTQLGGTGSSAFSQRQSNKSLQDFGDYIPTGSFQDMTFNIMNYSNSTTYKTCLIREGNGGNGYVEAIVSLWRSTSAITSITLNCFNAGSFASGSTFSLYGIQAGTPKAQGGQIVTTDGTYWYHAFTASGTFTPSTAITADYLVVAGGGGGGNNAGAGGGAGGLRSTVTATGGGGSLESALSLSANTTYSVTIGAGGTAGLVSYQGSNSVFSTITSTGGGRGGDDQGAGGNGGSGGGSATGGAGSGTSGQGYGGNNGGGSGASRYGGGGGGAGATATSSAGGAGVAISALSTATNTGVSNYYAGGGGGAYHSGTGGAGGAGGGGAGGNGNYPTSGNAGTAGTANTGGGGGAGSGGGYYGANGGSGIVIIRYAV